MELDPSLRAIVISDDDLTDGRIADGWALAVADGVAITEVRRGGGTQPIRAVPRALALAYFPAWIVTLAVRATQLDTGGDADSTWAGWSPTISDDGVDEW